MYNRLDPKAKREGREYLINKRFDVGDFEHDMRIIEKNQTELERKIRLEQQMPTRVAENSEMTSNIDHSHIT